SMTSENGLSKGTVELLLNNTGVNYQNIGDYETSQQYFRLALATLKEAESPSLFATLKDNLADSKLMLNDTAGVKDKFFAALEIQKDMGDVHKIILSKLRISTLMYTQRHREESIEYAFDAYETALLYKLIPERSAALQQLIKTDPSNQAKYI